MSRINKYGTLHRSRRAKFAKHLGQFETLESRQVMANDFLAGTAFIDANNNGLLDTNESYLANATIELHLPDGSTRTQVTNTQGAYKFTGLAPGDYKLVNLSAQDYAASNTQAISQISTVTAKNSNSIDVSLLSPNDLKARIDIDQFFASGLYQVAFFNTFGTSTGAGIGQLPVKISGTGLVAPKTNEFLTICVDLFNGLDQGVNGPYEVRASMVPIGTGSPHNGDRVAFLYNHFGLSQLSSSDAAALQVAVWELLYDANSSDPDGDLSSGNFSVNSAPASVINAAKSYLTLSVGKSESAVYLNVPSQPPVPETTKSQGIIASNSFNFANIPDAKIGDFVWHDQNADGIQQNTELGINGATVKLIQNSVVIATTTTANGGKYSFEHLLPGTYSVQFVLPNGYTQSSAANQTGDTLDSDGETNLISAPVTVASGQTNNTIDQGFYNLASLGDFVWDDLNANGIQETGEPGIVNATVTISGPNGFTQSTNTNSGGFYQFTGLVPGVYSVTFTTPSAYVATAPNQGADDAKDSDGTTASGITLISGQSDTTIDQGFYKLASLGNFVWDDLNANGNQEPGEPGIVNVLVKITGPNGFTQSINTDTNGFYQFTDLIPGAYTVSFTKPTGYVVTGTNVGTGASTDSDGLTVNGITLASGQHDPTIDQGFYKLASLGDFVWEDLNANGIQETGELGIYNAVVTLSGPNIFTQSTNTNASGFYQFTDLAPGTYTVTFATPSGFVATGANNGTDDAKDSDGLVVSGITLVSGQNDTTIDQGFYKLASLGDFVWDDLNANGIQEVGEPGIVGATVKLLKDGVLTGATATTGTGGIYAFTGLVPGSYSVQFVLPTGFTQVSPANVGSDTTDSDGDNTLTTAAVVLISGSSDTTLDQGFYKLASLGDYVWDDLNANGIQETGEPGIVGATVKLLKDGVLTGATATTGTGGIYAFTGLLPGSYSVQFVLPTGFTQVSPANVGSDSTDSDGDNTLTTAAVVLISGSSETTLDQGFYNLASLGDFVWDDLNANGIQELGEPGIVGATVKLLKDGVLTGATATTGTSGIYAFTGLVPGSYSVQFVLPTGFTQVSPANIGSDTTDSDGDNTLTTAAVVLISGSSDTTLDQGFYKLASLGDFVWNDLNANGIQEFGEPGIVGATVKLLKDGVLTGATATTGTGGIYAFTGLVPGSYSVQFVLPTGFTQVSPANVGSDLTDSDGDNTLTTAAVVLISGSSDTTLDQGFYKLASLGDYVWDDLNANGIQETGEPGIVGATVKLLKDGVLTGATATTGTGGIYAFTGLLPGSYSVQFVLPTGFTQVSPANVGSDTTDSDGDNTLTTAAVVLISGSSDTTLDQGFYNLASLATIAIKKYVNEVTTIGGEGLTPGYWKQSQHFDDWVVYTQSQFYNSVFGVSDNPTLTLLGALQRGGGGANALGRHAVAAILNAANSNVSYLYSFAQIQSMVQQAYATNTFESPKNLLEIQNQLGADLSPGGSTSANGPLTDADSAPGLILLTGNQVAFTYIVTNPGPIALTNVLVMDDNQTPANTADDFPATPVLQTGGFNVGDTNTDGLLNPGEQWKYVFGPIVVTAGQHTNIGRVSGTPVGGGTQVVDSNPANWFGLAPDNIDLSLTKTVNNATPTVGTNITFTILVSNASGMATATGVQVQDLLPTGLTFVSSSASQGSYTSGAWLVGTLASPASATLTIVATVSTTGAKTNYAQVQAADQQDVDSIPGNAPGVHEDDDASVTVTPPTTGGGTLGTGDTATIGFWQNKNGQALIKSLNGGPSSNALATWLATNFPYLYGANAGANNMTGKTNVDVAALFVKLFKVTGQKTDAQVMSGALAVYVTDSDLAGSSAGSYGFNVSSTGTGAKTFNVGANGTAMGLTNNTSYTVFALLQQANLMKQAGTFNANAFNTIFDGINQGGDIRLTAVGSLFNSEEAGRPLVAMLNPLAAGEFIVSVGALPEGQSAEMKAGINRAVASLNTSLNAYGSSLVVVYGDTSLPANIHLSVESTTDLGGVQEGVLGLSEAGGIITIVSGWNYYFGSDPTQIGAGQFDFQTVVTHELGHGIGLGHSIDTVSTMYPYLGTASAHRTLTANDLTFIEAHHDGSEALMAMPVESDITSLSAKSPTMNWMAGAPNVVHSNSLGDQRSNTTTVVVENATLSGKETSRRLNTTEARDRYFERQGNPAMQWNYTNRPNKSTQAGEYSAHTVDALFGAYAMEEILGAGQRKKH